MGKAINPNPVLEKLTLEQRGIKVGVPFFDPLLGGWLCVGEPEKDFLGFGMTEAQLGVISDVLRTAAFFETSDIKFEAQRVKVSKEMMGDFKNRMSQHRGISESIRRIPDMSNVHYMVLVGWYPENYNEMMDRFFAKYQSIPYLTYLWKTGDAKYNVDTLELELAMISPKNIICLFPSNFQIGPFDNDVRGMLEFFKTEYFGGPGGN